MLMPKGRLKLSFLKSFSSFLFLLLLLSPLGCRDGSLLLDEKGSPILHKIGEPDFKVGTEIGFAPTREEYAHYQRVEQELAEAEATGNTSEVERIQRELQHMRNTFLGEVPAISYTLQTNDPNADIAALHKYAASKSTRLAYEEYRKLGLEYLIPIESQ